MHTVIFSEHLIILVLGFILAGSCIGVFNKIPAVWLCDYGENPGEHLIGKRLAWRSWWPGLSLLMWLIVYLTVLQYSWTREGFFILAIMWTAVFCTIADGKYSILPDQGIIAIAILSWGIIDGQILYHLSGGVTGGGAFWLLGWITSKLLQRDSMGFGDIKLMTVVGWLVGFPWILWIGILTVFSAGIYFSFRLLTGTLKWHDAHPLGPFICFALGLVLLLPQILQGVLAWYLMMLIN